MKTKNPGRRVDPILQELYSVKAQLNRMAKFDVDILCAQIRKESKERMWNAKRPA